ncbi:uncharacterized protein LOC103310595 [Acyrthosiphon pisum]|uniref:Uncharacterized protein n=1 Tax=Acyrthosiphon pisum TaxID=7029 RepID=A0A8R2FBT5_ACYPI|nr:uncharacterized protein LOC103310595 [Acyrthosiphon pisum]|eukprot:XP_008187544.1 PREDICTED: uncharacterized protein LOC103310595 [Acyrthosiphon pisum]
MASNLKTSDTEKLNMGMKSILSEFEVSCDKAKQLKDNKELYNQMKYTVKKLSIEGESHDYATQLSNFKEALKNEQLFYFNKTGISQNFLSKDVQLESAAKILQETGYTAEPINIKPIESIQTVDNCDEIVKLVKKITDIEKKQEEICSETSELKSEQKKMYHGLPPNMDQAMMAVQIAEQAMKAITKKLMEKL